MFPSAKGFLLTSLIAFGAALFGASSAQAIVGGPFSSGSPLETGTQGTYTATMLGDNLVGNMTFAISDTDGSTGRYFVFHQGAYSNGTASGYVDPNSNMVTGVFGGGSFTNSTAGITVSADYMAGGWSAVVYDPNPSFRFAGSGSLSSNASNFESNQSEAGFQETVTTSIDNGQGTVVESTTTATALDGNLEGNPDQVTFSVFGYRSSTSTVTFPGVIVQGL